MKFSYKLNYTHLLWVFLIFPPEICSFYGEKLYILVVKIKAIEVNWFKYFQSMDYDLISLAMEKNADRELYEQYKTQDWIVKYTLTTLYIV